MMVTSLFYIISHSRRFVKEASLFFVLNIGEHGAKTAARPAFVVVLPRKAGAPAGILTKGGSTKGMNGAGIWGKTC
jgi:hypothetical protein